MIVINKNIIDDLIKVNSNYIIPDYLVKYYSDFDINIDELILLVYFLNNKSNLSFDINKISEELHMDAAKVLEIISSLLEKNIISIEVKKNNGIMEEFVSLELFYEKIKVYLIDNKQNNDFSDIYSIFEQEFGRTLSPTEYETITNWIECNISIDLIKAALKEAVLNGVNSLRYIDKILFEWNKKGYKNPSDIVRKESKDDDYIEELYDYDWLNN